MGIEGGVPGGGLGSRALLTCLLRQIKSLICKKLCTDGEEPLTAKEEDEEEVGKQQVEEEGLAFV